MKFIAGPKVVTYAQKLSLKLKNFIFDWYLSNECIPEENFLFQNEKIKVERIFSSAEALCTSNSPGNKVDSLPGAISWLSWG